MQQEINIHKLGFFFFCSSAVSVFVFKGAEKFSFVHFLSFLLSSFLTLKTNWQGILLFVFCLKGFKKSEETLLYLKKKTFHFDGIKSEKMSD